jgi:hypothetical protein
VQQELEFKAARVQQELEFKAARVQQEFFLRLMLVMFGHLLEMDQQQLGL